MKSISVDEIKNNFESYLSQDQSEPFLITREGQPIAVMNLIIDPDELERILLANSNKFQELLNESRKSVQEEGGMNADDFWQYVDNLER
jgi:PHD/YefM family antitoxin component YafN of YafNO toxin-antitoxin module